MSPPDHPDEAIARVGDPVRLPGVGTRVDFVDDFGSAFCVVNRDDGAVELYMPGTGRDRATIHLSEASAHAVGAFLAGRYELTPTLPTRVDRVLGGLTFDWVHAPRSNPETPMIIVIEDLFLALYLAALAPVLGDASSAGDAVLLFLRALGFLVVLAIAARYGAPLVQKLIGAREDELLVV